MAIHIKFQGINETKIKFKKMADMSLVKQAIKSNTVALQENAIGRMPNTYVKGYSKRYTAQHTNPYFLNNGFTGKVTMETEYSQYLEYGTRYMSAEPVMKPALNEIYPRFVSDIVKAAKGG